MSIAWAQTLHTLLTGRSRFADSDIDETLKIVLSNSFAKPRELNRKIPKSLEAICLKAMAFQTEDRYATASHLASDIEHFLADEPVSAAAESTMTATARWVRRNRNLTILAFVATLVIAILSSAAAILIRGEQVRADRERVEVSRRSVRLALDRGYQLIEQRHFGESMLWLEQALNHLPANDIPMRPVILTNMAAAQRHLVRRLASFSHRSPVTLSDFSPDGSMLLTKDTLGGIRFWNTESQELIRERPSQGSTILAARRLSEEKAILLSQSGRDLSVQLCEPHSNDEVTLPRRWQHPSDIASATISYDGEFVAIGGRGEGSAKVILTRSSDGQRVGELDYIVSSLAIELVVADSTAKRVVAVAPKSDQCLVPSQTLSVDRIITETSKTSSVSRKSKLPLNEIWSLPPNPSIRISCTSEISKTLANASC